MKRNITTGKELEDGSFLIEVGEDESYNVTLSEDMTEEERHILIHQLIAEKLNEQREQHRVLRRSIEAMDTWSRLKIIAKKEERRPDPPACAEAAFSLLAPKGTVDAQLGDLQEMFLNNVNRFGRSRASRLYWFEVIKAVCPALLRIAKKVGIYSLIVDYIRTKFGL